MKTKRMSEVEEQKILQARCNFYKIKQETKQSVLDFVARRKTQATMCS